MARNRYFEDEKIKKIDKSSLKKSFRYLKPHKKVLIPLIVMMLVISFVALLPTRIMSSIVDYVLTQKGVDVFGVHIDWLPLAIVLVACYAVFNASDAVFSYFRAKYMASVGHGVIHDMRYDVYANLQKLAFDYYDSRPNGKILVRATSYLDELANVYSNSILIILVDVLRIVFIVVWMFVIDAILTLIILASVVPMVILINVVRAQINRRRRAFRDKRSNRSAYISETIGGHQVIAAFNRKEKNKQIFDGLNKDCRSKWSAFIRVNETMVPIIEGFFYVGLVAVYWAVYAFVTNGTHDLSLGLMISFVSFSGMLSGPLNEISTQLQETMSAISNLESVLEVVDEKPTVTDAENAQPLQPIAGDVSYQKVCFSYDEGHPILTDVSFDVPRGKTVALVGPTGAGKTTLVSLLTRFYNLDSGRITIDGVDIATVSLYSLRSQIGVMMQDSFIFSGTIIENIRYGKPEASDEECIEAAKLVCAHDFISALPDGYYTKTVEQGKQLSTGQRQLISFARVLLTNPKILILDEATASIDSQTEEVIQQALDVVCKGRTCFVIAHRLSTVQRADCIFYVADKGIAEAGTHESLMAQKGKYYELVCSAQKG